SLGTQNEKASLLFSAWSESKLPRTCVAFTHAASVSYSGPGTMASFGSPLKPSVTATITHMTDLPFGRPRDGPATRNQRDRAGSGSAYVRVSHRVGRRNTDTFVKFIHRLRNSRLSPTATRATSTRGPPWRTWS